MPSAVLAPRPACCFVTGILDDMASAVKDQANLLITEYFIYFSPL
jgi:hypothetical protein